MTGLLTGLRVLDLSLWQPGHSATQLLADLGADVLKIEPPGGDRMRIIPDRFLNFNGHKKSLVLDLKQPVDQARLLELAATAEVVVEGFRPGVAARLGAGYEQLRAVNSALVYCSITGFGQTGPLAMVPGHDFNYQAYAGAFSRPAEGRPMPSSALIGDQGGGLAAAFAILAAVLCARKTGEGEHIDVSIADLMFSWTTPMGQISQKLPAPRRAARNPGMATYATANGGFVVLGIFSEDHFWDILVRHLGLNHLTGLGMADRDMRSEELIAQIEACFIRFERDALIADLMAIGVPIAPVLSREEALEVPHFHERGVICRDVDGDRRLAHPIQYRVHPARPPGNPPALNEYSNADCAEDSSPA